MLYRALWHTYPIQWLAGLASWLVPVFTRRSPPLVIFTAFHGDGFRGNTRVIYEALQQTSGHALQPVWLSRNPEIVAQLRSKYGPASAYRMHSWQGLLQLARAGTILFTHGTSDFAFLRLPRRAHRLQTYHGLPTKRGEYVRPRHNGAPNLLHRAVLWARFSPISTFLSTSDAVTNAMSRRFGHPPASFIQVGFPFADEIQTRSRRSDFWDAFWSPDGSGSQISSPDGSVSQISSPDGSRSQISSPDGSVSQISSPDGSGSQISSPGARLLVRPHPRIILYAPTYRKRAKTQWFPFPDFDLSRLSKFLETENCLLALRTHPNEPVDIGTFQSHNPRIIDAGSHHIESAEQVLIHCDVIVTDYSSLYLEGLLRDIPPIFLPYDLDRYERGFMWPYAEVTPGPKPATQTEFEHAIRDALAPTRAASYAKDRIRVRNLFWGQADGNATSRVIDVLRRWTTTPVGS
jgi:CDP-glycerol glycerophosphotransferase (TagB/SpsB family)